jgi:hypothetical protein
LLVNETLVIETLTLIGAAALSIALLTRVGLPAVLGYLFAGIVIGPLGFGLVAASGRRGGRSSWRAACRWRAACGCGTRRPEARHALARGHARRRRRRVVLNRHCAQAAATGGATDAPPWTDGGRDPALPRRRGPALSRGHRFGQHEGSIAFLPALQQLVLAAASLGTLLWLGRPVLRATLSWIGQRKSVDLFLLSALLLALGTAYVELRTRLQLTRGCTLQRSLCTRARDSVIPTIRPATVDMNQGVRAGGTLRCRLSDKAAPRADGARSEELP